MLEAGCGKGLGGGFASAGFWKKRTICRRHWCLPAARIHVQEPNSIVTFIATPTCTAHQEGEREAGLVARALLATMGENSVSDRMVVDG